MRILAGDFQEVAFVFLAALLEFNADKTENYHYRSYFSHNDDPHDLQIPQLPSTEGIACTSSHIPLRCLRVHGTRPTHP